VVDTLLKQKCIDSAVVLPVKCDAETHLVAFVCLEEYDKSEGVDGFKENILNSLHDFLPEWMFPDDFVFVETFPCMANGKVNRMKLKMMYEEACLGTLSSTNQDMELID
jgi:acyl-CoA synthetase (AMP-forming)/AMP-acid ligase II